jgi:hypothetical protein
MATSTRGVELFPDLVDGCYDCVDRVVLRAYFRLAQEPGGFRVSKLPRSRRYQACPQALRALAACLILRNHVIRPLLAGALQRTITHEPARLAPLDHRYRTLRNDMNDLFREVGIAA